MLRIFTKLYLLLIRYLFSLSAPSILYVGWWCSLLARSPPTLFPLSELPQPPLLASALADVFRASHMQLSSRYQSQYRPQFLIPTLLEHCSHKSIVHHLPECSRDLSHSIPTFLGCGKRIKTSGGQFLSIVIQNVLWRPPYAHISIRAPTPRQKHEHICTIHRHTCTCLYIWMHMCTKNKKRKLTYTQKFMLLWPSLVILALVAILEGTFWEAQIRGSLLSENEPEQTVGTIGREAWVASHLDECLELWCKLDLDNPGSLFESQFPHL